jgi:hypothetical protein
MFTSIFDNISCVRGITFGDSPLESLINVIEQKYWLRRSVFALSSYTNSPVDPLYKGGAILSNIDVNIQDVKDILQTLQIGKACGDDGISHQMMKATSETICLPLSILFTYSLRSIIDIFANIMVNFK